MVNTITSVMATLSLLGLAWTLHKLPRIRWMSRFAICCLLFSYIVTGVLNIGLIVIPDRLLSLVGSLPEIAARIGLADKATDAIEIAAAGWAILLEATARIAWLNLTIMVIRICAVVAILFKLHKGGNMKNWHKHLFGLAALFFAALTACLIHGSARFQNSDDYWKAYLEIAGGLIPFTGGLGLIWFCLMFGSPLVKFTQKVLRAMLVSWNVDLNSGQRAIWLLVGVVFWLVAIVLWRYWLMTVVASIFILVSIYGICMNLLIWTRRNPDHWLTNLICGISQLALCLVDFVRLGRRARP